jgi:hypothetical protein
MIERKQAFKAGVHRLCKSAGYDDADSEKLADLLLAPAPVGAQVVAKMVLDQRAQQVKEAGAFLSKRAADGDEEMKPITLDEDMKPPIILEEFKNPPAKTEPSDPAARIAKQLRTMDPWRARQFLAGLNPKGRDAIIAKYREQEFSELGEIPEEYRLSQPEAGKPDARAGNYAETERMIAKMREQGSSPKAIAALRQRAAEDIGWNARDMSAAARTGHRISEALRTSRQLGSRLGSRYRPRQMLNIRPERIRDPGARAWATQAKRLSEEQRNIAEGLYEPRESAGHYYSGMRSGRYAPRVQRGRQGRTAPGALAGRGQAYRSVAPPPSGSAQPQVQPENVQTYASPTVAGMTGTYEGKPFSMRGAMGGELPSWESMGLKPPAPAPTPPPPAPPTTTPPTTTTTTQTAATQESSEAQPTAAEQPVGTTVPPPAPTATPPLPEGKRRQPVIA